jgi:hypothetical protein
LPEAWDFLPQMFGVASKPYFQANLYSGFWEWLFTDSDGNPHDVVLYSARKPQSGTPYYYAELQLIDRLNLPADCSLIQAYPQRSFFANAEFIQASGPVIPGTTGPTLVIRPATWQESGTPYVR